MVPKPSHDRTTLVRLENPSVAAITYHCESVVRFLLERTPIEPSSPLLALLRPTERNRYERYELARVPDYITGRGDEPIVRLFLEEGSRTSSPGIVSKIENVTRRL